MSVEVQLPDAPGAVAASVMTSPSIPPLKHGDYLTRSEFERRYRAMPEIKKAELIEGRVVMPSPVRAKHHGAPHSKIVVWLGHYEAFTHGVSTFDNTSTRLDTVNEPQPDAQLRIDESLGGQSRISEDDYIEGGPELVAEIAASSAPYDLGEKLRIYRRNGVREYIVWSIEDQQLKWFSLEAGEGVQLNPDENGILRSRVFPGLWLDVAALLKGDMATVLSVVQQGVVSPEHETFVERLQEAKS